MESGTAKILIVDDDDGILRLVARMLQPHGYEVISARDGAEAIRVARLERPHVILMDVLMPGMDGYTALDVIKKDRYIADMPVVMLTGIDLDMNKKLAEGLGASGYLTKPFTRKELVETLAPLIPSGRATASLQTV